MPRIHVLKDPLGRPVLRVALDVEYHKAQRRTQKFLQHPPILLGALHSKRVYKQLYTHRKEYWFIPRAARKGRRGDLCQ